MNTYTFVSPLYSYLWLQNKPMHNYIVFCEHYNIHSIVKNIMQSKVYKVNISNQTSKIISLGKLIRKC